MFWGYPKEGCLPREEYAFIQGRKGFVKMAMKHGVPIVPVYCFGNTHAMHKARTPWVLEALSRCVALRVGRGGACCHWARAECALRPRSPTNPASTHQQITRLLRTSLILTWGRWGLPIPYRVPLLYAVGKPLRVLHRADPSRAEVDAAHAAFCRALQDLFDAYKHHYHDGVKDWGHKTLRIV